MFDYLFMILIFLITLYSLFIKKKNERDEDWKEVSPKTVSMMYRYLYFGAINAFFANMIFDIEWLIWITVYSAIGMVICLKSEKIKVPTKIILTVVIVLFFEIYQVPSNPISFENYINSREDIQCKYQLECVVISYDESDETFNLIAEVMPVTDFSYKYYFLFSKGYMKIGEETDEMIEIKGVNIGGFWFEF